MCVAQVAGRLAVSESSNLSGAHGSTKVKLRTQPYFTMTTLTLCILTLLALNLPSDSALAPREETNAIQAISAKPAETAKDGIAFGIRYEDGRYTQ